MLLSPDQFQVLYSTRAAWGKSYPLQRSLDLNGLLQIGSVWFCFYPESPFLGYVLMTAGASSIMPLVLTPSRGVAKLPGRSVMTHLTSTPRWVFLERDHVDFVLLGSGICFCSVPRVWTLLSVWIFVPRLSVFCLLYRLFVCLIVVVCCLVPLSLLLVRTSVI